MRKDILAFSLGDQKLFEEPEQLGSKYVPVNVTVKKNAERFSSSQSSFNFKIQLK